MKKEIPVTTFREASDEVEKLTFRLFAPYTEIVARAAKKANLKPNQFARLATMVFADHELLEVHGVVREIRELVRAMRHDLERRKDKE